MTDDRGAALAALGPYFTLDAAPDDPASHGWKPFADLLRAGGLAQRVAFTSAYLGRLAGAPVEPRVAASTVSLGLFARVLSPVVGSAVLGVRLPPPATWWWRPFETGPWPVAAERASGDAPRVGDLDSVRPLLAQLVDRFAEDFALSRTILWGNAASALFGAAAALRTTRPDLVPAAASYALGALDREPFAGTGDVRGGRFVRRSCCLYYRVPGGGYCGDCVLAPQNHP